MKIVATKYKYDLLLALDGIGFLDEYDEDFESIKENIEQVPEGKLMLNCDEKFDQLSELKKVTYLNEFLTVHPNSIIAKNELLFVYHDSDQKIELISKLFAREMDHIENGTEFNKILSLEEFRIVVLKLSEYYASLKEDANHKYLLKWTLEKGFHELAKEIDTNIHDLEPSYPTADDMMYYDDVNIWTHNILISDIFDSIKVFPYNDDFIDLINWDGTYLDHEVYLKVLDSSSEHILHDVTWLFYQNFIAYRKGEQIEGVTGILMLINFINHFEIKELVELAVVSIITMPEDVYRSMVYDVENIYLDDLLLGMAQLNSEKFVHAIMDDEVIDCIDYDFRWSVLFPFFKIVAILSCQDNAEGLKFQEYFRLLDQYYKAYPNSRQWLIAQAEDFNYTVFKELINNAYDSGDMDAGIFGNKPEAKPNVKCKLNYDKKLYFKNLDERFKENYTKSNEIANIELIESKIKSDLKKRIKAASAENEDFESFLDDFEMDNDMYWPDDESNHDDEAKIIPFTVKRDNPKVGRNDPCPCGSGKKYKKCCLNK